MTDEFYTLAVTCDHRVNEPNSQKPPRTVTEIIHVPKPPDDPGKVRFGWLEWSEGRRPEGGSYNQMQTYFGEARRLGRSPTSHDIAEMVPGMSYGQRWRFYCEDCHDTRPVQHEKLLPLLEKFRDAGVPTVSLHALVAMLP